MGHQIFVLAPTFPNYKDTEKNIIRYPSLPNPFIQKYPLGIPIVPASKIAKLKPDLIHTHHPLIIGKFASYLSEKLHIPLFFTAHTQYEQYLNYYFPKGFDFTSRMLINDLASLSLKCQKVICPSPQTETRLKKYGIENTQVLFNGIDTKLFSFKKQALNNKLTVIYTGRIQKEKNPFFLIKVAKELKKMTPNFQIIIIGDGRLLPKVSDLVIKNKLEDNVQLTGQVSQKILPNIYQSADLFFTPSISEVMPLSVLEAQSCGLPTVALTNSNLESIVIPEVSGLLLKPNPNLVAKEILCLFKNKKKLKSLSLGARKVAEKNSLKNCAKELIKLYTTSYS